MMRDKITSKETEMGVNCCRKIQRILLHNIQKPKCDGESSKNDPQDRRVQPTIIESDFQK